MKYNELIAYFYLDGFSKSVVDRLVKPSRFLNINDKKCSLSQNKKVILPTIRSS